MSHKIVRLLAVLALCTVLAPAPASADLPPKMLGPGDANVNNIGNKALIRWSKFGFVYIAGKHNTHLTVTYDKAANTLLYRDTGTRELRSKPKACDRRKAAKGIAVLCKIPASFDSKKMFVQVWPRLGNDFVDGRTLPVRFRLWVLADAGRDVVHGGAGRDFVNGAKDDDRIWGGPGNDHVNSGKGNDVVYGGPGNDRVSCSEGFDIAYRDGSDGFHQCESVR